MACRAKSGFSLLELLVTLGIISLLMVITLPILGKVRDHAKVIVCVSNQKQIVTALEFFAIDNRGRYPQSVATIGRDRNWRWQEPTMMTAYKKRSTGLRRSMSAYLHPYIRSSSIMFCPNAPWKYKHLQQAWDAGEEWDNPDTGPVPDPVMGSYCYYWNYLGCLADGDIFMGPWGPSSHRDRSTLLVSDYFGYDHWRSPESYGSCVRFKGAATTEGSDVSSAYWSRKNRNGDIRLDSFKIKLHAGYSDGHVASYQPSETVPMKVSFTSNGSRAYPDGLGPGIFYLPEEALY